jgi:hypothetical protein
MVLLEESVNSLEFQGREEVEEFTFPLSTTVPLPATE